MAAKKQYNADSAFEPIEVVVDGQTYEVKDLTKEKFDEVTRLGEAGKNQMDIGILSKQLAILCGVEADRFLKTDLRKLANVIRFISGEIGASAGGDAKNV